MEKLFLWIWNVPGIQHFLFCNMQKLDCNSAICYFLPSSFSVYRWWYWAAISPQRVACSSSIPHFCTQFIPLTQVFMSHLYFTVYAFILAGHMVCLTCHWSTQSLSQWIPGCFSLVRFITSWPFDRTESKISSIPSMLCHYQWFLNMKYSNLFKFLALFWRMSVYLVHCLEIFHGFMTQSGSTLGSCSADIVQIKSWDCCQKLPWGVVRRGSHLSSSYCSERFYGFSSAASFLLPWKMGTRKWSFLQRSWPWI